MLTDTKTYTYPRTDKKTYSKKYKDPLNVSRGFDKVFDYWENNKTKNWTKWLSFDRTFPDQGKQGLVGLFSYKDNPDKKLTFKISQYINYLIRHEYLIMRGLTTLSKIFLRLFIRQPPTSLKNMEQSICHGLLP